MQEPLISPEELAARWGIATITLDRWRWAGKGPRFFKPGNKIKYRVQDIEAYEEQKARQSTAYTQEEMLLRELQQAKMKKQRRFK
ncbi:MAG: DNA-binding protein [Alphaproteobacteria bacterium]|jgi:predicted site-specific integrase-resolvase|nr:DNA-binding protein [Alphaproteobacteria bacterium]